MKRSTALRFISRAAAALVMYDTAAVLTSVRNRQKWYQIDTCGYCQAAGEGKLCFRAPGVTCCDLERTLYYCAWQPYAPTRRILRLADDLKGPSGQLVVYSIY